MAQHSATTAAFADTMRPLAGGTASGGVIDDLATCRRLTAQQVVARRRHWEEDSEQEGQTADADAAPDGLTQLFSTIKHLDLPGRADRAAPEGGCARPPRG